MFWKYLDMKRHFSYGYNVNLSFGAFEKTFNMKLMVFSGWENW